MSKTAALPLEEPVLCTSAITLGADGKPPREIKLLPFGDPMASRDGRIFKLVDRPHAERVIAASKARLAGCDFVLDYDHQSALAAVEGVGGKAPAAAWGKDLELRADGIWLTGIEYTPAGEAALAAREYRYLSPWFYVHPETRMATWIRNAGLTNSPNLDLPALAHQEQRSSGEVPDMKTIPLASLCAALALAADTATEASVLAAIEQLKTDKSGGEAALASVRKGLGLGEEADEASVLASITAAKATGAPDPTKYVPKAGYDELAGRLSKIEEDRILASVDAAVTSGKITPAMKGWAIELGKKDEAALASYLDKVVAFGGAVQLGGKVPAPEKGKLTTEEAAICAMTGVSHADFLKTREEEAA